MTDLETFRRLLGADGCDLVERLDALDQEADEGGGGEAQEVAADLATWVLVTYRQLLRDAPESVAS